MKRFLTLLKRTMIIILGILLLLALGVFLFLQHPKFGKAPNGERLVRIQQSPQYKNGKLENFSPTPSVKAFKGTDSYSVLDFPDIDFLLISHDHYDHLDYTTIVALRHKVKSVICGLGVGSHFEYWGYPPKAILENDWGETLDLDGIKIHTTKARHFSGRAFARNNTLWVSFVVETSKRKIYVGGDSGYDSHLAEIGTNHGPFDLAILDNGQYNVAWKEIHFFPEEVVKAVIDLQAKRLMPIHSAKFSLAMHPWDEPLNKVSKFSSLQNVPLVTPIIGEKVRLDDENQIFKQWWKEVT